MDDDEDKQQQHYPAEMLYVVETIELTKNDSSTSTESFKLTLSPGNLSTISYKFPQNYVQGCSQRVKWRTATLFSDLSCV